MASASRVFSVALFVTAGLAWIFAFLAIAAAATAAEPGLAIAAISGAALVLVIAALPLLGALWLAPKLSRRAMLAGAVGSGGSILAGAWILGVLVPAPQTLAVGGFGLLAGAAGLVRVIKARRTQAAAAEP